MMRCRFIIVNGQFPLSKYNATMPLLNDLQVVESRSDRGAAKPRAAQVVRQVPAVARAIAILRLIGASRHPLGVNEIARQLGMVPSTCLHILRELSAHELVGTDRDKRYALDAGLLNLVQPLLGSRGFAARIQPELDRLCAAHSAIAVAMRITGLQPAIAIAVARSRRSDGLRIDIDVGSRAPALLSANGLCVAAFGGHSTAALRKSFASLRWSVAPVFDDWMKQVESTRRLRCAVDPGHSVKGLFISSAPVFDGPGSLTHTLSLVSMAGQFDRAGLKRIGTALKDLAKHVSEEAGRPNAEGL